MEKKINEFITELQNLEIEPEYINEQFEWVINRLKQLIAIMKEANVNRHFLEKFEYMPRFLADNKSGSNVIIKENILKLKQRDVIQLLSDEHHRRVYLKIQAL